MLEEASIRPHLIRAIYQWCMEEGYTPYILAYWSESNPSKIPARLINDDGKIVFNVSPQAVRHLVVNADGVFFTARFWGKTAEIHIPPEHILSIYAQEKQSGISFPPLSAAQSVQREKEETTAKIETKRPVTRGEKKIRAKVKVI